MLISKLTEATAVSLGNVFQTTSDDGFLLQSQIKENKDKIKLNNQLPYLVGNVVEVLEMQPEEDEEEDGANVDLDSQRRGKCVVLKTSTRQTIFLPVVGLVDADTLKPADLVGVNKVLLQFPYLASGALSQPREALHDVSFYHIHNSQSRVITAL